MTDVGLIVRWKEHNDVYELESHHQFKISQFDNTVLRCWFKSVKSLSPETI